MTTILDIIERRLLPEQCYTMLRRDWEKSGLIIAGYTHLDKRGQLEAWARTRGWSCRYDPHADTYMIERPMSQLDAQAELASIDRAAQPLIERLQSAESEEERIAIRGQIQHLGARRRDLERRA